MQEEKISQAGNALLIVDVQNDFLPPNGSLAVKGGNKIIPVIKRLMTAFDTIVTTQDWHPSNHVSFESQHQGDSTYDKENKTYIAKRTFRTRGGTNPTTLAVSARAWPPHCIQEQFGAEIHADLPLYLVPEEAQFKKGSERNTEAYGPFLNIFKKKETGIKKYLCAKGVKTLYVCGLALDYCVKASCLQARAAGFKVVLILDATKAVNVKPGDDQMAIKELKEAGVIILNSQQVLNSMEARASRSLKIILVRKKLERLEDLLKDYIEHLGQEESTPTRMSKKDVEEELAGEDQSEILRQRKIDFLGKNLLEKVARSKKLLVDREKGPDTYLIPLQQIIQSIENDAILSCYRGSKCEYYFSCALDLLSCLLIVPAALRAVYSKIKYNNINFLFKTTGERVADRTKELVKEMPISMPK